MFFLASMRVSGATFVWNDSSNNFNSNSSWFGGSGVPGANDVAFFAQSSFANSPVITSSVSVGGIQMVNGAGALTFSAASGTTLTLGASGLVNYDSSRALTFNSANLSLALATSTSFYTESTISIGNLTPSLSIGANTLTLDGPGTGSTIATAISGASGSVIKSGTGTWVLSAANTYTGGTTVNGGVLAFGAAANATGALVINAGGTLRLAASNVFSSPASLTLGGGTLQISGGAFSQNFGLAPLSMGASSTIDFGSGLGASALVFANSSGQTWAGTLTVSNYSSAGGDTLRFGTSSNALSGAQLAAISFDGIAAQIDSNGFVSPVPEPAAYALVLGAGVLATMIMRRRKPAVACP